MGWIAHSPTVRIRAKKSFPFFFFFFFFAPRFWLAVDSFRVGSGMEMCVRGLVLLRSMVVEY